MLETIRFRAAFVVVTVVAALFAMATPAHALAAQSTTPADGSVVQSPGTVEIEYDLPIDTGESTLTLRNKNGTVVAGTTTYEGTPEDTIVFTPSSPLTEVASPYTAEAHADALLNEDTSDDEFSFTIDNTAPDPPTITDATDPVNAANDTAFAASGDAEEGSEVEVTVTDESENEVSGTTTANSPWELTDLDVSGLDDGELTVTATATDPAGNTSPASAVTTVKKDTDVPAAPAFDFDNNPDPIDETNVGDVTLSGTAEADAEIDVSIDDDGDVSTDPVEVSATADEFGDWSTDPTDLSSLVEGEITATATATDAAGNVSPEGEATTTKDLGPPGLVSTSPAGGSTVQSPAEVTATYVEPLDEADSTISVEDSLGTPVAGSTSFSGDGKTIVFTPTGDLTEAGGPYDVTVNAEDTQGSDPTVTEFSFTVDNTAPAAPTITDATDPVNAANDEAFEASGEAEEGSEVEVTVTDESENSVSDTTTANSPWELTGLDVSSLEDGTLTVTATATDVAGNTSSAAETTVTKDTVAPDAPTIEDATDPVNAANDEAFEASGEAEEGSEVEVTVTDESENSVSDTTTANTPWELTGLDVSSLEDGTLTVTATATDAAGNTSAAAETTVAKDTVAPDAPTIEDATDPVTPDKEEDVDVSGDAESGSTVEVTVTDENEDSVSETTTASSPWALTIDVSSLANGTLAVTATATDAAGNTSAPSAATNITKSGPTGVTFSSAPLTINGTYIPIAGDFNGDGMTDIIWYAPGTTADFLWLSNPNGTYSSSALTINGDYRPIVGEFTGDAFFDVIWYAPGTAADFLWTSNGNGTFSSAPLTINGTYIPIVGDFNGDGMTDIAWYAPGSTADFLWTSTPNGTYSSSGLTINGTYIPISGEFSGDSLFDIIWYAPGTTADFLWTASLS